MVALAGGGEWGGTGAVQLDRDVADLDQVSPFSRAWRCVVLQPVLYHEPRMTIRMSYAATPHPPAAHRGPLWSRAHEATMRECLARSDQRRGVARLEGCATHVRVGYASWSDAE